MVESRITRMLLRLGTAATLVFIYVPLAIVGLYAFNENVTQKWPIENYSTKWFSVAFHDEAVREALVNSPCSPASARPLSPSYSGRSPRWRSLATASSGAR